MRKVALLAVIVLLAAAAASVLAVTVTYVLDDFNGNYRSVPTTYYPNGLLEEHFNPYFVNASYERETGSPPPGPPASHATPLPPHIGTDSCQAFRYYENQHRDWFVSYFESRDPYDPDPDETKEIDLPRYAQNKGWLPIDISQPITYSVRVWGENQARNPDDPAAEWRQRLGVNRPWPAAKDPIYWTSANNRTWHTLSITRIGLMEDKYQWITLESWYPGTSPDHPLPRPPFDYWHYLPPGAVSTMIWENLMIAYTAVSGSVPEGIGVAKTKPDNTPVNLTGKIATALNTVGPSNRIYIEEQDRSSGIWVIPKAGVSLPPLYRIVTVTGIIFTDNAVKERYILEGEFVIGDPGEMEPVALSSRAMGGGDFGPYVKGAKNQVGLNNIGLLVRHFGKVTWVDPGGFFYVNDGGNYLDGTTHNDGGIFKPNVGVRVYDPTGGQVRATDYVRVDGIVAKVLPAGGGTPIMAILPRIAGDVVHGTPPWP